MDTKTPSETILNTQKSLLNNFSWKKTVIVVKSYVLTTKTAVKLLLNGTLKRKVCKFCLHITTPLSEMDQIMQIANKTALYKVTIRDIVASSHPFVAVDDPNLPNKICEKCLNKAIQSYLFAQQCEQSGRALRNCFEDMYEKLEKLDPLERTSKRGRQKLNPNYNVLYTENRNVIDYAEPVYNLINAGTASLINEPAIGDLECKKCWEVLPNVESLANHEKIHPKSMWFNCRLCGKSFAKKMNMKHHLHMHGKGKIPSLLEKDSNFVCKQCGHSTENHNIHLQHIEKHKFQMVLEHVVEKKMDKLCSVCFNNNANMIEMDKIICLHGGYPELTGERTVYNILGSTIPEMIMLRNHTGTKICEKCLDHAITSYIFMNKTHYTRKRLDICITNMMECLKDVQSGDKIFIEIAQNYIMPLTETYDDNLLLDGDEVDETKLKVDVLEDEFRMKSDEESSSDDNDSKPVIVKERKINNMNTYQLMNGYRIKSDIGEFLTFKRKLKTRKPRYTCPICNKKLISGYFLQNHVLKHINCKVDCENCKLKFKSKFQLHEHMKMAHVLKLQNFSSCQYCGRAFRNENKRYLHEKCHKLKQCELCLKIFVHQRYYDSHMQRHALRFCMRRQRKVQNCSFCEKECLSDNDLSIHVNKIHLQIKPYSCDMCEKQFYTDQNLRDHKLVHSMFSVERCQICSKLFKCRQSLVVHIRKHIGSKPFQCSICHETFYSEKKFKQHMKKWHGGSIFCKLCKKVFVNKKGLKDHVNGAHSIF